MRVAGSHSGPIAAEPGIPVEALPIAARNAGLPVRQERGGVVGVGRVRDM